MTRGGAADAVNGGRRSALVASGCLVLASLPAVLDSGAMSRGAALLEVAASAHPYLPGTHAGLLYLWLPIVTISGLVLVLAPGLLLSLAIGAATTAAEWLLTGLALSTVVVSLLVETVEALAGGPIRAATFGGAVLATTLAAAAIGALRPPPADRLPWSGRRDRHTLLAAVAGVAVLLVALLPKFLWETFNGDGAHAFEAARLLLHQPVPFWTPAAGDMSTYPGLTTFLSSYPTAWFIRLFGDVEASARIPYLLFLGAGLYPGLILLIETGRRDAEAGVASRWLVWAGLAVYSVVMGFSATYNPYHADIALPATEDTLAIAWFLGLAWATITRRLWWVAGFALLTYVTSPAGLILVGLWIGASVIFLRPVPWRPLATAIGAIAMCLVAGRLAPGALSGFGLATPGTEHEPGGLARRLLHVQWRDWRRLIYAVVPGGILPAFSVLLVKRQDGIGRAIAGVAVAQFVFFYLQARISLHYFTPAMVLPLAVYWRTVPSMVGRRWATLAAGVTAAAALMVSLPADRRPHLAGRPVGTAIDDRLPGYADSDFGAFKRSELLSAIFPRPSHRSVPDSSYGGSPLIWFYYAHRPGPGRPVAYVLQAESAPAPAGGRLAAVEQGVALYIIDESAYARDQARRPPNTVARIYRIPKRTLFAG